MFFNHLNEVTADPIFGLTQAFKSDPRKEKVNLVVGIYRDDELKSEMPKSARDAGKYIFNDELIADYLPIDGIEELLFLLMGLVFKEVLADRIYGAHVAGGTSALRIGAEFLAQEVSKNFYLPNQSWPNHHFILEKSSCQIGVYPYYSELKKGFDFDATISFLNEVPEKSVVILHACCHNPTGSDPTIEEWQALSKMMKEKNLFPFFDFAYQGFGDGIEKDAQSIRIFLKDGHQMAVAYSCSKNFSMYC